MSRNRFDSKVCLVTGAGAGIGRATALAFAREGATIVVAELNPDAGKTTLDEVLALGGKGLFVPVDIAHQEQVEHMVSVAVATFGRLDCAVNSAGIAGTVSQPTHEYPEADWLLMLSVNLTGTWYCMKAQLTQMLKQGGGTIVNIASAAGLRGQPENVPYAASKHGVVGLTRTAAIEYATKNIRINALCPTAIETPMLMEGRRKLAYNPEAREKAINYQAMKRMGQPGEVADVALWLCSGESSFMTGHALPVDGGAFA
ncbi:SDR family NAD(P)-dependent oxidoreductase [uncultured Fibrella sp.]|uniref:SDR family NAD(P)-dependent oxidoreductase n=1 Tax=uncultured Fibrella sp. TaxID=1284596 RepID=UPI0035C9E2C6